MFFNMKLRWQTDISQEKRLIRGNHGAPECKDLYYFFIYLYLHCCAFTYEVRRHKSFSRVNSKYQTIFFSFRRRNIKRLLRTLIYLQSAWLCLNPLVVLFAAFTVRVFNSDAAQSSLVGKLGNLDTHNMVEGCLYILNSSFNCCCKCK